MSDKLTDQQDPVNPKAFTKSDGKIIYIGEPSKAQLQKVAGQIGIFLKPGPGRCICIHNICNCECNCVCECYCLCDCDCVCFCDCQCPNIAREGPEGDAFQKLLDAVNDMNTYLKNMNTAFGDITEILSSLKESKEK
jgi:hypothetical protein